MFNIFNNIIRSNSDMKYFIANVVQRERNVHNTHTHRYNSSLPQANKPNNGKSFPKSKIEYNLYPILNPFALTTNTLETSFPNPTNTESLRSPFLHLFAFPCYTWDSAVNATTLIFLPLNIFPRFQSITTRK